ncbi:MAG: metallophosphoesterase family protein [Planctomycetota bacterium]|jgi:predicted phosphodiesterase
MKRGIATLCLLAVLLTSCGGRQEPLGRSDFCVLVLADTHTSNDEAKTDRLKKLVTRVNSGKYAGAECLIIAGDVVASVYGDCTPDGPDKNNDRLQRTTTILNELNVAYYLAMGNHDYKICRNRDSDTYFSREEILDMERIWTSHTGFEPYYAFTLNGWKFVVLNSFRGRHLGRHFDDEQLKWFESQLAAGMPTIVIFHHPLRTDHFRLWCGPRGMVTQANEPRLYHLLRAHRQQIKGIFVGHGHMWVNDTLFKTIKVHEPHGFGDGRRPSVDNLLLVHFDNGDYSISVVRARPNKN